MTIQHCIDYIKTQLRVTSRESYFSDEYVYTALLKNRNLLLHRELAKKKKDNDYLGKTICMPLCIDTFHDCTCVPEGLGCKVLRSKYKLPKYITVFDRLYIEVLKLTGQTIINFKKPRLGKNNKYRKSGNTPYAAISNQYLYVFNIPDNLLDLVLIKLIPEDPAQLQLIPECNPNGDESGSCYSPHTDDFLLEGHLYEPLFKMTLQDMGVTLKLQEDSEVDQNSNYK